MTVLLTHQTSFTSVNRISDNIFSLIVTQEHRVSIGREQFADESSLLPPVEGLGLDLVQLGLHTPEESKGACPYVLGEKPVNTLHGDAGI